MPGRRAQNARDFHISDAPGKVRLHARINPPGKRCGQRLKRPYKKRRVHGIFKSRRARKSERLKLCMPENIPDRFLSEIHFSLSFSFFHARRADLRAPDSAAKAQKAYARAETRRRQRKRRCDRRKQKKLKRPPCGGAKYRPIPVYHGVIMPNLKRPIGQKRNFSHFFTNIRLSSGYTTCTRLCRGAKRRQYHA